MELLRASWSLLSKSKKTQAGNDSSNLPQNLACDEKPTTTSTLPSLCEAVAVSFSVGFISKIPCAGSSHFAWWQPYRASHFHASQEISEDHISIFNVVISWYKEACDGWLIWTIFPVRMHPFFCFHLSSMQNLLFSSFFLFFLSLAFTNLLVCWGGV